MRERARERLCVTTHAHAHTHTHTHTHKHTHTHTNNARTVTHTTPRYEIAITVTAAGAYKVSVSSQGIGIAAVTRIVTPALPSAQHCLVSANFISADGLGQALVSDLFVVMVMTRLLVPVKLSKRIYQSNLLRA